MHWRWYKWRNVKTVPISGSTILLITVGSSGYIVVTVYILRLKKLPDAEICQHFVPADQNQLPFVSKEYLSKELLQYLLNLDLLPQIENLK